MNFTLRSVILAKHVSVFPKRKLLVAFSVVLWGFLNPENKIMNFLQIIQLCRRHNFPVYPASFKLTVLSLLAIVKLSLQQQYAGPENI